jgi:hypothetical protein
MLAEWHLSPEYILDNWTDMQIEAFWSARNRRIVETGRALRPAEESAPPSQITETKRVTDTEFFSLSGIGQA